MKISKSAAYGLMGLAAVMWATSGTLTELALGEGTMVMEITVFSVIVSTIILLPLIGVLDRKSLTIEREDFLPLLGFGLVTGTFFSLAWYYSVEMTSVATAVILLYLYPSIVTIASVFLLKEGLTPQKALALPLTFIGCVLVAGAQEFEKRFSFDMVGIALGIYAAIGASVYYLWGVLLHYPVVTSRSPQQCHSFHSAPTVRPSLARIGSSRRHAGTRRG